MLAAFIAACCAANGVPLRDPRKPSEPELFHEITLPAMSVMVTIVLLKDACTCTSPCGTCLRSFFLNVFFLPFFSGAAAPPAAAGFAMSEFSVLGSQFSMHPVRVSAANWEPRTKSWVLCFRRGLLLVRNRSLARAFAGARVGMRALSADRQVAAVAVAAVGTDFDEALDVHRNFLAQIAFHHAFRFNDLADAIDFVFAQILDFLIGIDLGLLENLR